MAANDSTTAAVIGSRNTAKVFAAATVNNTLVAAGVRQVVGGLLSNVAAYAVYLKLYDKATAPVAGTDIPVMTIALPAGGTPVPLSGLSEGHTFTLGLGYAITKLIADTDTTVVVAGDARGVILFK